MRIVELHPRVIVNNPRGIIWLLKNRKKFVHLLTIIEKYLIPFGLIFMTEKSTVIHRIFMEI